MATINTYDRPEMARLSYAQTDPLANLVYNMAFPAMDSMSEAGKFREVEARAHYLAIETRGVDKYTTPDTFNYSDAFRYFKNIPIAGGFKFSNAELADARAYGFANAAAMVESRRSWLTKLMKKGKEKALYDFVTTNTNFEGAAYYNNAATAWSSVGTADPLTDVMAGKTLVRQANAGIMSRTAYDYCQRNATIKNSTTVMGARRDSSVDPTITVDFLRNYFQLKYLWIAEGDLITDSSDPTDETRAEIWGDSMLLFFHNPTPGPDMPSWMQHIFWRPGNAAERSEGWLVKETQDPRAGGVGVMFWDLWNYNQYLLHEKSLAYRIDNLY